MHVFIRPTATTKPCHVVGVRNSKSKQRNKIENTCLFQFNLLLSILRSRLLEKLVCLRTKSQATSQSGVLEPLPHNSQDNLGILWHMFVIPTGTARHVVGCRNSTSKQMQRKHASSSSSNSICLSAFSEAVCCRSSGTWVRIDIQDLSLVCSNLCLMNCKTIWEPRLKEHGRL